MNLDLAIALLERTPATLDTWLRGLPDDWTRCNEGGTTWTAYDIVGHLAHGERTDWLPRVKAMLEFGDDAHVDLNLGPAADALGVAEEVVVAHGLEGRLVEREQKAET